MRRDEFQNDDPALFEEVVTACLEGFLALNSSEGFPRAVAVNFAAGDGCLYFHGALAGDKYDRVIADDRVGFTMARPYSLTPSDWATSNGSACPATQLYVSVEVTGRCSLVEDRIEKAIGLQALMEKYQPEGGYRPISHEDSRYDRSIAGVGVFRVDIQGWTGKIRLAQNQSEASRRDLIERLRQRGRPLDLETADRIAGGLESTDQ
jgi:uncharacterized protein